MKTIEVARKSLELNNLENATIAYTHIINMKEEAKESEIFEAACFLLYSKKDIELANNTLVHLFNEGYYIKEILDLMMENNFENDLNDYSKLYQKNIKCLRNYKFLFKKQFIKFEELKYRFFRFDKEGLIIFNTESSSFGEYVNINKKTIDRNFFNDLEKPILACDVYSNYQLNYLVDNVRLSEWVARENHIYLQYTDWEMFCAYLQLIDFSELLNDRKIVFLIEDEINLYPIDFKKRFNVDYSKCKPMPIKDIEITRLILHEQLSSHNGGDFFNEVFDGHPNLIVTPSIMLDDILFEIAETKKTNLNITDKDIFVDLMCMKYCSHSTFDLKARITPTLFFQPHCENIYYELNYANEKTLVLDDYADIQLGKLEFLEGFKYIKTFAPIRRPTNSYAATIKFLIDPIYRNGNTATPNALLQRIENQGYYHSGIGFKGLDNVIVRFEDGKLNPKATFTALARFLDIPYTKSMEVCSFNGEINPESLKGNVLGFDTSSIYKEYKEFAGDAERYLIECFSKEVYKKYGYDRLFCKKDQLSENEIISKINECDTYKKIVVEDFNAYIKSIEKYKELSVGEEIYNQFVEDMIKSFTKLNKVTTLINREGHVLDLIPLIEPDKDLLENPLYH